MVQNNYKGEWETISPCNCNFGRYCLLVSSFRGAGSRNRTDSWVEKKFSEDILRQSYQYYADLFGESKKTVKTAMDKLEKLQVIRREFRTVSYGDGLVCNNVMYVELNPDILYQLTFLEGMPAMKGTNNSCVDVSDNKKGGSLPTKSDSPMEIYGERGIPKGKQVSTNLEAGYDEMDNIIPTKWDTGLSKNRDTYPYTSAYISDGESYLINQSDSETEKTVDAMDDVNAYIEIIKENIEYDHNMKYGDKQNNCMMNFLKSSVKWFVLSTGQ